MEAASKGREAKRQASLAAGTWRKEITKTNLSTESVRQEIGMLENDELQQKGKSSKIKCFSHYAVAYPDYRVG